MKIEVGSKLIVKDPTQEVLDYCKKKLTVPNPDYYKKQKLGKWTGSTPQNIHLYERNGGEVWLPFGCIRDLWSLYPVKEAYSMAISPIQARSYKSNINLYPYQEEAVNKALRAKNGLIVMPCGGGKTQTGLELIARIGGRALWLTHTQDLLNQSKERANGTLDLCGGKYGTITAGKVNIGTHITFATVQTMCKLDLTQYRDCFDVVIVDECQHCCGSPTKVTQFYKVVSNLSARYKIGLTATPKRSDGLEIGMYSLLGGIIHEVPKEAVKATTCPVRVRKIETGYMPDYNAVLMGDGTIDYSKIVEDLTHNEERFRKVLDTVNSLDGSAIVLANRVEYLQRLCENARPLGKRVLCLSGMGQSKKAKEERKQALYDLNNGEIDCVFASYKLAAEGLDCPNLKYVVLATPEKDPSLIQQATGRVGRKADEKEFGTVIDFVDEFGMYKSWKKKREAVYKKLKYDII